MKITALAVLLLCLLATPALAGVPAKTELSLAGSLINFQGSGTTWQVEGDLLFPLGNGAVILGPSMAIGKVDELNRFGAGLEWNITGQKHGGLFVGGTGHYFVKDSSEECATVTTPAPDLTESGPSTTSTTVCTDDPDRYTLSARAGVKFNIGTGALLKLYVSQVVGGAFKDEVDLTANVGIGAKF